MLREESRPELAAQAPIRENQHLTFFTRTGIRSRDASCKFPPHQIFQLIVDSANFSKVWTDRSNNLQTCERAAQIGGPDQTLAEARNLPKLAPDCWSLVRLYSRPLAGFLALSLPVCPNPVEVARHRAKGGQSWAKLGLNMGQVVRRCRRTSGPVGRTRPPRAGVNRPTRGRT